MLAISLIASESDRLLPQPTEPAGPYTSHDVGKEHVILRVLYYNPTCGDSKSAVTGSCSTHRTDGGSRKGPHIEHRVLRNFTRRHHPDGPAEEKQSAPLGAEEFAERDLRPICENFFPSFA